MEGGRKDAEEVEEFEEEVEEFEEEVEVEEEVVIVCTLAFFFCGRNWANRRG